MCSTLIHYHVNCCLPSSFISKFSLLFGSHHLPSGYWFPIFICSNITIANNHTSNEKFFFQVITMLVCGTLNFQFCRLQLQRKSLRLANCLFSLFCKVVLYIYSMVALVCHILNFDWDLSKSLNISQFIY